MKATEGVYRLNELIEKYGDGELVYGIHADYENLDIMDCVIN